jgi:hypothetical protein
MQILSWIGFALLVFIALLLVLYARRAAIARRGGTVDVSLRLSTLVSGRGWSHGVARFADDELRWYRVFSVSPRPRRVLNRNALEISSRRRPDLPERLVLPADWAVVRCVHNGSPLEIAMDATTLTGFLSWIEAAPPGAASRRLASH